MLFSERNGYKTARELIQTDSIDADLLNSLWNVYHTHFLNNLTSTFSNHIKHSSHKDLFMAIYREYFKIPIDEMPATVPQVIQSLKKHMFSSAWYEVYDFIEFTLTLLSGPKQSRTVAEFNRVLERENSGYRILEGVVTPITSDIELNSIDSALASPGLNLGAKTHLKKALDMLSDRQNPDYRNSIKESISAVESACKVITKDEKGTLGSALRQLETAGQLHPALRSGFSSLYGFTSDSSGIRHALLDESNLGFSDASYMLVVCSAFVNYLTSKQANT